jgi:ornithine cyclodeaminase/alanine dehydrogenase-like protein (mu-crystallin family)
LQDERLGRRNPEEITVYKSTGHAVEDVAAASVVYRRAVAGGVGAIVPL